MKKTKTNGSDPQFEEGSGNVFGDLGLDGKVPVTRRRARRGSRLCQAIEVNPSRAVTPDNERLATPVSITIPGLDRGKELVVEREDQAISDVFVDRVGKRWSAGNLVNLRGGSGDRAVLGPVARRRGLGRAEGIYVPAQAKPASAGHERAVRVAEHLGHRRLRKRPVRITAEVNRIDHLEKPREGLGVGDEPPLGEMVLDRRPAAIRQGNGRAVVIRRRGRGRVGIHAPDWRRSDNT